MISADSANEYTEGRASDHFTGNRRHHLERQRGARNMTEPERWISAISGGALAAYGLTRGSLGGVALALIGGGLVYRGATGYCDLYHALGIDTAHRSQNQWASVQQGQGLKVEKSVTINKPPSEIYHFWRNFENLPRFMNHLESVRVLDNERSHWVAKAPAGMTVEWDAIIINEEENQLIAWRSLEGATIPNAGSVRFEHAPNNRGCVVRVTLSYDAPGGTIGSYIAKLFGEEPGQQVEEDLRRFKQLMETGEVGSPQGHSSSSKAAAR